MAGIDNVVYGAFGQTREAAVAEKPAESTAITQHTPHSLEQRFGSQVAVLLDLAQLLLDPALPSEVSTPLHAQLRTLKESVDRIKTKLEQSHTNDQVFLEVQPEITAFGKRLIEFETEVLNKTGASIEVVEQLQPPQSGSGLMQLKDRLLGSTSFWIAMSVGVGTVGALAYWHLNKRPRRQLREPEPSKIKKVKLRRALAAR